MNQHYNIIISKRMIWAANFNRFSHPCTVINALAEVEVAEFISMLLDVLAVATALKFIMSTSLEEELLLFCRRAFACWAKAILDCDRALQARMPSYHVWWSLALLLLPQFLNQEPPGPQQLFFPDFAMEPHVRHTELMIVVVAAGIYMWIGQKHNYNRHCLV